MIYLTNALGETVYFDNVSLGREIELIDEFDSSLVPIIITIPPMISVAIIVRKKKEI